MGGEEIHLWANRQITGRGGSRVLMNEREHHQQRAGKETESVDFLSDLQRVKDKIGVTGIAVLGVVLAGLATAFVLSRVSG